MAVGRDGVVGAEMRTEQPNRQRVLVKCNSTDDLINLNEMAKDRAWDGAWRK